MTEPVPDTWQDALTRRLRTLLRTGPVMRVESTKGKRGIDLDAHDLRAVALRAIDLVIKQICGKIYPRAETWMKSSPRSRPT